MRQPPGEDFDQYAAGYTDLLQAALSVTGESQDYYATERVKYMVACLERRLPSRLDIQVLDFGCGVGSTARCLLETVGASHVTGIDTSVESLARARATNSAASTSFHLLSEYQPAQDMDVVYSNGVFHHILPAERSESLRFIHACLKPGGHLALWENNPWNPGTRWVMARCEFDHDAIPLTVIESRRLVTATGFEIQQVDFLFYFPRALSMFRPIEAWLRQVPLGGQYQVLARKPGGPA